MALIRKDIQNIDAYTPGRPIEEVRRQLGIKSVIKLASNENPLGPSPRALKAMAQSLKNLHRYPEGTCYQLKKKLAKVLNVNEDNLMFGNGSDELIDIILKAIREPGADIITADVTFIEYKIAGAINDFRVITVPLRDFTFDLDAIRKAITPRTKAIFIANPNNPTGTYVTARDVDTFLNNIPEDILIVFDEAYFEYVEACDFPVVIPLVGKKNVAVLRTFSKIYGLAGLRVGYMIADKEFIASCQRVRQPFNVNTLAQVAATAALDDKAFLKKTKAVNSREKKALCRLLRKLGIRVKESETNFLFVEFDADGKKIFPALLKKGVIIRDMNMYNLNADARITVGTPAENKRLVQALRDTLAHRKISFR